MNELNFDEYDDTQEKPEPQAQPEQSQQAQTEQANQEPHPQSRQEVNPDNENAITILRNRLAAAESFLGFNPLEVEQGSDDWFTMRLGVCTASQAKKYVAKQGSATRQTYMNTLLAEVATGMPAEEVTAKAMAWGNEHEADARQAFEFATGLTVHQLPFVYRQTESGLQKEFGCSPDGITSDGGGLEIKCPFMSANHVDFIINKNIKDDYIWQVQFSLWVTGLPHWYFASYDPRMKTKVLDFVKVLPDPKKQQALSKAAEPWIADFREQLKLVL